MGIIPGPQQIAEQGAQGLGMTQTEIKLLDSLGIRGKLRLLYGFVDGRTHVARALVVLRGPIVSRVELPQPKAASVLYLQQKTNWKIYPPEAPTIQYKIKFWPSKMAGQNEVRIEPNGKTGSFAWE